jgi:hypothetical protein
MEQLDFAIIECEKTLSRLKARKNSIILTNEVKRLFLAELMEFPEILSVIAKAFDNLMVYVTKETKLPERGISLKIAYLDDEFLYIDIVEEYARLDKLENRYSCALIDRDGIFNAMYSNVFSSNKKWIAIFFYLLNRCIVCLCEDFNCDKITESLSDELLEYGWLDDNKILKLLPGSKICNIPDCLETSSYMPDLSKCVPWTSSGIWEIPTSGKRVPWGSSDIGKFGDDSVSSS